MANSMDQIRVSFGVSLTQEDQALLDWEPLNEEEKKRYNELK